MEEALIKRVLPHNTEAEQLVIGCMLMDKEAISAASEIIHSDDFYGRQYGAMFEAITELYNEGKPTDLVAVRAAKDQGCAAGKLQHCCIP